MSPLSLSLGVKVFPAQGLLKDFLRGSWRQISDFHILWGVLEWCFNIWDENSQADMEAEMHMSNFNQIWKSFQRLGLNRWISISTTVMQHFGRQSKFIPPAYSPVVWDAKRPTTLAGYWMMDSSWECGSQQDSQSSTQKETHLKLLNYDKVQEPPKKTSWRHQYGARLFPNISNWWIHKPQNPWVLLTISSSQTAAHRWEVANNPLLKVAKWRFSWSLYPVTAY